MTVVRFESGVGSVFQNDPKSQGVIKYFVLNLPGLFSNES